MEPAFNNAMAGNENQKPLTALVANAAGEIFELDGYGALGMDG